MSLAGLVPPMTDAGDMLCDGGYVDNLPVSSLRSLGANVIFAVDVGSVDDRAEMAYGKAGVEIDYSSADHVRRHLIRLLGGIQQMESFQSTSQYSNFDRYSGDSSEQFRGYPLTFHSHV